MLLWVLLLLVILVGLAIPILSIVLDSPVVHRMLEARRHADSDAIVKLRTRLDTLETDVDELTRSVEALREESAFLRRLLQDSHRSSSSRPLPPPEH